MAVLLEWSVCTALWTHKIYSLPLMKFLCHCRLVLFHVVIWLFVARNIVILFRVLEYLGSFCCDFGIMGERIFFLMKFGLTKYLWEIVLWLDYQFFYFFLLLEILLSFCQFWHCGCEEIVLVWRFDSEFSSGHFPLTMILR